MLCTLGCSLCYEDTVTMLIVLVAITVKLEHPVTLLSDDSTHGGTEEFDTDSHMKFGKLPLLQHFVDATASSLSRTSNFQFAYHEVLVDDRK